MYPSASTDEPLIKKRRVDAKPVLRQTFVESMLLSVSNTLASDSQYGYNSSNQIRRRVEDITSAIDDQSDDPDKMSSSRAVLESRFALGCDDAQYLSQAVSMLWSGDGGERLRITPMSSMPEIMRVASAKGMVGAMAGVVKKKRALAFSSVKRALRLAAWLVRVEEIRRAFVEIMVNCEDTAEFGKQVEAKINEMLNNGNDVDGVSTFVENIHEDARFGIQGAKSVIFALLVLLNPSSKASNVVNILLRSMQEVVVRTEQDVIQLYNTAVIAAQADGVTPETVDSYKDIQVGTGPDSVVRKPPFQLFVSSLNESKRRITTDHSSFPNGNSNAATNASEAPPALAGVPDSAPQGWMLVSIVSPLWKQKNDWESIENANTNQYSASTPSDASGSSGAASATQPSYTASSSSSSYPTQPVNQASVSRSMKTVLSDIKRGKIDISGEIGLGRTKLLDGVATLDESFVQFCMVRGLCGFRGAHQPAMSTDDSFVKYNFPNKDITNYRPGEFSEHLEIKLKQQIYGHIIDCEDEVFASEGLKRLDTDFFGNALKRSDTHRPKERAGLDGQVNGVESARRVSWMPVKNSTKLEPSFDTFSQMICQSSVYEFMAMSLDKPSVGVEEGERRLLNAAVAVAKIRQLVPIAYLKTHNAEDTLHSTSELKDVYVTRPCKQTAKKTAHVSHQDLRLPVDAGMAQFRPSASGPSTTPLNIEEPTSDFDQHPFLVSNLGEVATPVPVQTKKLSDVLSTGMDYGWEDPGDIPQGVLAGISGTRFSLFIDAAADSEPVKSEPFTSYSTIPPSMDMDLDDIEMETMFNAFAAAHDSVDLIDQLEHEELYVQQLDVNGSDEQVAVFGINRSIEEASKDRRTEIWTDARREIAISGDRLYRFVTELTGAIGEAADSSVSWEDEDLKTMAKEASTRQKAMAERVSRFQTKLVESVVSSTLRSSKLQLDVRDRGNAGNELVVVNSDVKDSIRQITSGEAGHGFFEASVELGKLMGSASQPITIKDLVQRLQLVSNEFQDQIQQSLAVSAPASYARISEPRNSYMMHLKPDTTAAIRKAFDLITSELQACPGYHRHVYLWEFVEGKDWILSTRFAELTGLMLQNTRMRSGSFAAYVGTSQIVTNTHNIRMQLQRLKTQTCEYISTNGAPNFLASYGRTVYFGGSVKPTQMDIDRKAIRDKSNGTPSFGGADDDGGATYWAGLKGTQVIVKKSTRRRIQELAAKLLDGTLSPEAFGSTPAQRLHRMNHPDQPNTAIPTASTAEVAKGSLQAAAQQIPKNPEDQQTMYKVGIIMDLEEAEKFCGMYQTQDSTSWVLDACKQYRKNTQKEFENFAIGRRFGLPSITKRINGKFYYLVKLEITDDMIKRAGDDIVGLYKKDNIKFKFHMQDKLIWKVNITLYKLFCLTSEQKTWTPHPAWTKAGFRSTIEMANVWILPADPVQDRRECGLWKKAMLMKALMTPALQTRPRFATAALIAATALTGATVNSAVQNRQTFIDSANQALRSAGFWDVMEDGPTATNSSSALFRFHDTLDTARAITTDHIERVWKGDFSFDRSDIPGGKLWWRKGDEIAIDNDPRAFARMISLNFDKEYQLHKKKINEDKKPTDDDRDRMRKYESVKNDIAELKKEALRLQPDKDKMKIIIGRADFERYRNGNLLHESIQLSELHDGWLQKIVKETQYLREFCETQDAAINCFDKLNPQQQAELLSTSNVVEKLVDVEAQKASPRFSNDPKAVFRPVYPLKVSADTSTKEGLRDALEELQTKYRKMLNNQIAGKTDKTADEIAKMSWREIWEFVKSLVLRGDVFQSTDDLKKLEMYKFYIDVLEYELGNPGDHASKTPERWSDHESQLAYFQAGVAAIQQFQYIPDEITWKLTQQAERDQENVIKWVNDPKNKADAIKIIEESLVFQKKPQKAQKALQLLQKASEDGTDNAWLDFSVFTMQTLKEQSYTTTAEPASADSGSSENGGTAGAEADSSADGGAADESRKPRNAST